MRTLLRSRLNKHFSAASALVAAAAIGGTISSVEASVVYSGAVNINIPSTTAGIYLNVVTGVSNIAPGSAPGWDVDPWSSTSLNMFAPAGGAGPGGHQGTGTTYYNLAAGTSIGPASTFSGTGTATINAGFPLNLNSSNNLIGFRFQNEANGNAVHYGWMRISLSGTAQAQPRAIVEYAYENVAGTAILAGDTGVAVNGACCKSDGTCTEGITSGACTAAGGTSFVANSTCAAANCPQPGRCCKPDGTCAFILSATCTAASGTFTAGADCTGAVCTGACCKPDGTCDETGGPATCTAAGGVFGGLGSLCANQTCTGACCATDGTCSPNQSKTACTGGGGTYQGNGSTCANVNCLGACCKADGTCVLATGAGCAALGGTFRGQGSFCGSTQPCVAGACCLADGTCQFATPAGCTTLGGTYGGDGTGCGTNNCPGNPALTGACCDPNNTCQVLTRAACLALAGGGGFYRGNGVLCADVDCAATGACCVLDGTCSALSRRDCRLQAGYYGGDGSLCATAGICPTIYTYAGSPVAIPDTQCTQQATYAEIVVADTNTITHIDAAFLMLDHTFQGDLHFGLVHVETGHGVDLMNRNGTGSDFFGTGAGLAFRSIDQSPYVYRSAPIGTGAFVNNVAGDWRPENPLAAFVGESSAGHWRLYAQDCAGGDTGTITVFKLSMKGTPANTCYANCDNSTQPPVLNVADFTCFLQKYAAGDPYANCDASTQPPVLNVADFTCFLQKYAAGCT